MWRLVQSSSRQRRGRWVFLSSPPTPRWLARIPSDFDQYMAKFSRKTRHNLRREQRRLAGVFETVAELRVVTDREELCDFMAQAVAIADRSALAHAISGQLRSDGFVRRLERLADLGWLRCYALVGDGQPIALAIGWTVDGVCCLHRAAFDNRWLPYSPGKALIYRIIESLCADQDVEWLDFMHYHWDYKQFFATDMYTELSAYLIRFEPRTAMAFAPFFFFRSAKQALDAGLALAGVHRKVSRQLRRPGHKSPSDQGAAP
jgi:CelD/BcsL family acetyltransferase involved in cellulose biosynthesis